MNQHIPVLGDEVVSQLISLAPSKPGIFFDGTFGGGGYSKKLIHHGGQVIACDLDTNAIERGQTDYTSELASGSLNIIQGNFADVIATFDTHFFDGITLDLGYSSNQLEIESKGFSYLRTDQILDLRYDETAGTSASNRILSLKEPNQLGKILYTYSGENFSNKISLKIFDFIEKNRPKELYVHDIVDCVLSAIPQKFSNKKNAILSRVWQSLRIWTNDEFPALEAFLPIAFDKLKPHGVLAIVCFHSLEDKIVTHFMRKISKPFEIDDFGNKSAHANFLTPKAIAPSEEEIATNARSRSATLRILIKR